MKKLRQEDDLVLLTALRNLNRTPDYFHLSIALVLFLYGFLWVHYRWIFWTTLILMSIVMLASMNSTHKEKQIIKELKRRRLI